MALEPAVTRLILAIDTATPAVTAGIVERGDVLRTLAERVTLDARAHAECLTPTSLPPLMRQP